MYDKTLQNFSPTIKFSLHSDTFDLTFSYLYLEIIFQLLVVLLFVLFL
jgi:hypothetical protein